MRRWRTQLVLLTGISLLAAGLAVGQRYRRGVPPTLSDPAYRNGVPLWDIEGDFKQDIFTFVRINYSSDSYYGRGYRGGWSRWRTDWPDSDLNFSYRLQQLTALQTHPEGVILQLTDDALFDYPFIYVIEPGSMLLSKAEVLGLRRYLLSGGFMMVDDFWGDEEWDAFYKQIKRVFPDREPDELPLSHPIFHCVYDLQEKPQIPSIGHAMSGYRTERWDAPEAHYKALFDDDGRMMAIICHNTDLGDGWEREGENAWYFREYSEKRAYPMGINIVVYAMTH